MTDTPLPSAPSTPLAPPASIAPTSPETYYRLDHKDRIVEVGLGWNRFAIDNGAEELAFDGVIGHPIRRYVAGDVTRMFLDTMLAKARFLKTPFTVPYRCDSPSLKRYMQMHLSVDGDAVICRHTLMREEALAPIRHFMTGSRPAKSLIKRCSMCNRLTDREGRTVEPEALEVAPDEAAIRVIYHVCPDCHRRVRRNI